MAILQHCAKTRSVTEANRKRLDAFHHNCLRKLLNVTWNEKREMKLQRMQHEKISRRTQWRRDVYAGLVMYDDGRLHNSKSSTALDCGERRKRGRPHLTWRDKLCRDNEYTDTIRDDVCLKEWTSRSGSNGLPDVLATEKTEVKLRQILLSK